MIRFVPLNNYKITAKCAFPNFYNFPMPTNFGV